MLPIMIWEVCKNLGPIFRDSGFCLESQYYPNSINQEGFASPVLKAGEKLDTTTAFRFTVKNV